MRPGQERSDGYPPKSSLKGMAEGAGEAHNDRQDAAPMAPQQTTQIIDSNSVLLRGGGHLTSASGGINISIGRGSYSGL